MSYGDGTLMTYTFAAEPVDTAGQSTRKIAGPKGATGRVVSMVAVNTTAVTAAAAGVNLRSIGGPDVHARLSVPISGIAAVANDFTVDDVSDSPADVGRIPADTALELDRDGAATAGDADIIVGILWDTK